MNLSMVHIGLERSTEEAGYQEEASAGIQATEDELPQKLQRHLVVGLR